MSAGIKELVSQEIDERQFVADLFHALNQPLSALRCMLDLAMNSPRTPADYQEYFKVGLGKVELANVLAQSMREFLEAKDSGASSRSISFQACLREAAEHFRPVAQDSSVAIVVHGAEDFYSCYDQERLQKILFYIFDLSFHFMRGKTLDIQIAQHSPQLTFSFIFDALESEAEELWARSFSTKGPHWEQQLKWMIAQQLLRSAQGNLRASFHDKQLHLVASLPLINPAI